jgi:pimeloyl-ACP methyl ester carboxylesterase
MQQQRDTALRSARRDRCRCDRLMDALKLNRAVLAGYHWDGRAACVAAALWPERCTGLVSVNSYLIQDIAKAGLPIPPSIDARGAELPPIGETLCPPRLMSAMSAPRTLRLEAAQYWTSVTSMLPLRD